MYWVLVLLCYRLLMVYHLVVEVVAQLELKTLAEVVVEELRTIQTMSLMVDLTVDQE